MTFIDALHHTLGFEGGYARDRDDPGGETYRGISRAANPDWPGWAKVDEATLKFGRTQPRKIDDFLRGDQAVEAMVEDLYRDRYWRPLGDMPDRIKAKVFDCAVNAGSANAAKILQRALNDLGAGIKVDGAIGPATRGAFYGRDEAEVVGKIAEQQAAYYKRIVDRKPKMAKFLNGWLRRAAWIPSGSE
jgi:lysozyme family protein